MTQGWGSGCIPLIQPSPPRGRGLEPLSALPEGEGWVRALFKCPLPGFAGTSPRGGRFTVPVLPPLGEVARSAVGGHVSFSRAILENPTNQPREQVMTQTSTDLSLMQANMFAFPRRHFISAADLNRPQAEQLLNLADSFVGLSRQKNKKLDLLKGRTVMNLFFENSTRTQSSFELAGKRLGADVVNMSPRSSSMSKGETLIDTAMTLNAMQPDLLVIRHASSGAAALLAQKVGCSVVNAGDGQHEHPTQALLDALSIRRSFGQVEGLTVAICGDVAHSRVARSNVAMLQTLGARVRLVGPPTLMPSGVDRWGVEVFHDMRQGIAGCDLVMMLRLQLERMNGAFVPSMREYFRFYGLDREKLAKAAPHVRVMHPGPMNRGVEIDSEVADDPKISLIQDQVEMGVAARMAVLASLAARLDNH
ncbi:MAG: aspartate carbamoyl transferase [Pseudomonadota bacterium]